MSAIDDFRAAMHAAGMDYNGPVQADGKFYRIRVGDDKSSNSWYVLHPGSPAAGAFGCWKRGLDETWCEQISTLSQTEWKAVRQRWQGAQEACEQEQTERRIKAAKTAGLIHKSARPVAAHRYLTNKTVRAFGDVRERHGMLVLPLCDADDQLHSLQFIGPDGTKKFLSGGRVAGCFFALTDRPDGPLVICEGYATGASILEATGFATICAMNCGNLSTVASTLRAKWPKREIIITADNDQFTTGNPGLTKATEAAKTIRARLAVPQFKDITTKPTDFNDLQQLEGAITVKTQIDNAITLKETITPAQWFSAKFPALPEEYGVAILEETNTHGIVKARDIGEDFFAATLGTKGSPNAPTIFMSTEDKFYTYVPEDGVFIHHRDPVLLARMSRLLLECARACKENCETGALEFRFRDAASLSGVLRKARGLLEVPHDYFATDLTKFVPCANGMLRLSDKSLLPFNPGYRRRNKLGVPFDPSATCPLFLNTLMRQALDDDELDLLQRWCGLALIGENMAQRIMILSGTAGGGKGTFIRVLTGIIGQTNLASLRPQLLGERFELGRFLGKTLLYGADVPENFLNQRGASVLKSLTGYDPMTLEFKNSNESPPIVCRFNVIVTSNSRLTVNLEGDTDAWRRRLAVIEYRKSKPEGAIADLDRRILVTEGPGVLNWMLEGLDKIRAAGWQLRLTARQQGLVDNLLLESDSQTVFARECLTRSAAQTLTVMDCFCAYVEFCNERGWKALSKNKFSSVMGDEVTRQFGITTRHDVPDQSGKSNSNRGWKGLALVGCFPKLTEKKASETSENQSGASFSDTSDTFSQVQPAIKLIEELL